MNNKKVTIDVEWFLELVKRSKDYGVHAVTLSQVTKERDELKDKLDKGLFTGGEAALQDKIADLQAECDRLFKGRNERQAERDKEREKVRLFKTQLEAECEDKIKVVQELNTLRDLNRKCYDENERLKYDYERAENALKRISDIIMPLEKYQESNFKCLCDIIREYNRELAEK